ncbi:hypothetical protein GEV27_11885 [Aeromicrobium sp. S22]|uniref:hypothetical protein n=1 Tax=Aeromicrobium sp. S22 TaxID=2662029 RepID=UPI00129DB10E|nr:hypothetical protein [Aeromicrobium sp. S22]MRK02222.1 hypothetical protein [Aeromicrobium sp. S22]
MDWIWVIVMALRQTSPAPADQWAVRLATLDADRAAAFAEADPTRLATVYVAGSRAMAADAATIRSYADRDGRVVGARLRVLTCRVVSTGADRATLDVVDVLAPAQVEWGDGSVTDLPRDRPSRHRVTLHRTRDGWRIAGSRLR